MESRDLIVRMLRQLLEDMQAVHQQGAGYFSCTPIARRYNKLLAQARALNLPCTGLMDTFEEADEADPKDPSLKMKAMQAVRIEIGQLVSLLESAKGDAQ